MMYALIQVQEIITPNPDLPNYGIRKDCFHFIGRAQTIKDLEEVRKDLGKEGFESNYIIIQHF